jgi:hypothetical protein
MRTAKTCSSMENVGRLRIYVLKSIPKSAIAARRFSKIVEIAMALHAGCRSTRSPLRVFLKIMLLMRCCYLAVGLLLGGDSDVERCVGGGRRIV